MTAALALLPRRSIEVADEREELAALLRADALRASSRGAPAGYPVCEVPASVVLVASQAMAAGGSLADRAVAGRIVADQLSRCDLELMAAGDLGLCGGGEAGTLWAAEALDELDSLHPLAWLFGVQRASRLSSRGASTPEGRALYWHDYIRAVHGPGERRIMVAVAAVLREWREAIVERVPDVLGDVLPRTQPAEHIRIELPTWLLHLLGIEDATAALRADVGGQLLRVLELAFRRTAKEAGISASGWAPTIAPAKQAIGLMITRVTDTTIGAVAKVVSEAIARGASVRELQDELRKMPEFGRARALTIARTETGRVATAGTRAALDQAKALGLHVEDEWITARDEAVRESHQQMDGVTITHGSSYHLPSGVSTTGPGQSGVAEEDINCRCAIRPHVMKEPTP